MDASTSFQSPFTPGFGKSLFGEPAAENFIAPTSAPQLRGGGGVGFGEVARFGTSGGFGSTTTPSQSSPFGGSTSQQTQSAFGGNAFGKSDPIGYTPAFGVQTISTFGAGTTPGFGSQPTSPFGAATTSGFGSQPAFGPATSPGFGATSAASTTGTSATPFNSCPGFGATSSASTTGTPATHFDSCPGFGFSLTPFSQTNSGFGSIPFGSTPSARFGSQNSFGQTYNPPAFRSQFGPFAQRGPGSRVTAYAPTDEADAPYSKQGCDKLQSISSMTIFKQKSHEELRWEDVQLGDKGGPNPQPSTSAGSPFGQPTTSGSPFGQLSSSPLGQPSTSGSPFGQPITSGAFDFGNRSLFSKPSSSLFVEPSTSHPFGSSLFGRQLDTKQIQDLRKAVELEREVERRVSEKHIAFLTSLLGKLDSLTI